MTGKVFMDLLKPAVAAGWGRPHEEADKVNSALRVDPEGTSRLRFWPSHLRHVSPAEELVLRGVASGLSNAAIASSLYIEINTVKSHLVRLNKKFDLHSRAELVVLAYETGLFVPGWVSVGVSVEQIRKIHEDFPFRRGARVSFPLVPRR